MLGKPKYGWTTISIGDWSDRCSYLTDVPYCIFNAIEKVLRVHTPAVATFDAEGWENIIVFDEFNTYIISGKSDHGMMFKEVDVKIKALAEEFLSDIEENIDLWSQWGFDMSEDEIDERRKDLEVFCEILKRRLDGHKWVRDKLDLSDSEPVRKNDPPKFDGFQGV